MLRHRDVLIKQSGRIRFGGVAQSWNTHLTWTKISGGIRCWDQFIYDRDDVNDPKSTVGVLAIWGTQSYFDAEGSAWGFHGTLKLPPQTAEHSDVLQMATEAFYAAAGPAFRKSGHVALRSLLCTAKLRN